MNVTAAGGVLLSYDGYLLTCIMHNTSQEIHIKGYATRERFLQ